MKAAACRIGGEFKNTDRLQFLAAKRAEPDADTSAHECEIDQLVSALYGLTDEEIKPVEESAQR